MEQEYEKVNDGFYINRTKLLGKGNFGKVYKGYSVHEHKIIAIKFMSKKLLDESPGYER